MQRIRRLSILFLVALLVGSSSSMAMGQEPPLVQIQVDGEFITLERGKNVHPQTYDLLVQDTEFASRMDWVFMDGMWIPLARGVEGPLVAEEPLPGPEYAPEVGPCTLTLLVPAYSQCASPWRNACLFNLGTYPNCTCGTMCGMGCAITSATMVFRYYGASKDPGQVNTCCGANNCRDGCRLAWACAANACSENKATFVGYYAFTWGAMCGLMAQAKPPIVKLVKPNPQDPDNPYTHFVVVYKSVGKPITDPTGYSINDPADGSTYKTLANYTANGWTPTLVAEYAYRPPYTKRITNGGNLFKVPQ